MRIRKALDWCCKCKNGGESVDHLLLHCSMAGALWSVVFQSFGIAWVVPERVVDFLFGWHNSLGKFSSDIWNLVPLCLMWTIWRERNRRTFKDVSKTMQQILECFTAQLFEFCFGFHFSSFCFRIYCIFTQLYYHWHYVILMFFVFILYAH